MIQCRRLLILKAELNQDCLLNNNNNAKSFPKSYAQEKKSTNLHSFLF